MRLLNHFVLFIGLLVLVACSPSKKAAETPIPEPPPDRKLGEGEPAQGSINGKAWEFKSGRAFVYRKYRTNYLVIQLWGDKFEDPCKEKTGSVLQVRLTAPQQMATWMIAPEDPFNSNLSIFFTDLDFQPQPRDNMRADLGEISFGIINKFEVHGYLNGSFKNPKVGGTHVAGDFAVPLCQESASFGDNF
ncbi:hypothetical protein [Bdellovibrio sp. HCB337]|uniref:hypothetical protein n=1 Tax=Bdellovibrio sp. HCB337 TaxID=3394358 RepID=UPI0039A50B0A